MPLYICRWINGDISAVSAPTELAARELLDEIGDTNEPTVSECPDFMVHFRLPNAIDNVQAANSFLPPLAIEQFGEQTMEFLEEHVYPHFADEVMNISDEMMEAGDAILDCSEVQQQQHGEEAEVNVLRRLNSALELERNGRKAAQDRAFASFIPEVDEFLKTYKAQFHEKFGRDPGPSDPILYDPDLDTPQPLSSQRTKAIWGRVIDALAATGCAPELVYAAKKTGMVISPMNMPFVSPAELAAWEHAIDEYNNVSTVQ